MRWILFVALAIPALASHLLAQEKTGATTLTGLRQELNDHISQAKFASAVWGVKVVSLDSGKTVFEHNAGKLLSPASNSKLYAVALALDRLGADYRIKTSLYSTAKPSRAGVIKGDLLVYGRGDPTINARLHNNNIYEALEQIVAILSNPRIKRITGDLVADDSFFRGPPLGSGWAWDDMQHYYGAEISALTINDNTLQVTVKPGANHGDPCKFFLSPSTSLVWFSNRTETASTTTQRSLSFYRLPGRNLIYVTGQMPLDDTGYAEEVTFHNPAELFGCFLKEALLKRGIKVAGKVRTINSIDRQAHPIRFEGFTCLGQMESLPLCDIVREVMKPSQNLYTDLLLAHVGERTRREDTPKRETSEDLGIADLTRFLEEAGIKRGNVHFEEGSGLSRNNLTTPEATLALLVYMSKHKAAEAYVNSLPIAGVDGTLRNRMKGTAAEENVRAKTGTLRWANALSGYVKSAAGERLAFSIMLNRYHNTDRDRSARAEVDAIAIMLAEFAGRSE